MQIDSVSVPDSTGRIGMTFCPGKKQRGAMTGDWHRDLILDLEAIRTWGATVIINLIEDHEMVDLGVQDTAQNLPAGIDYMRLPIPDFGVVAADFIEKELAGETIEPQTLEQEGTLWSPARIEDSEIGPQLFLSTTSVSADNVNDERLWGNVEAAAAAAEE